MKLLIIDNYDSFTYNLYQQIARVSGALPRVVANDAISLAEILAYGPDLVIISPGPGRPERPEDFGVCAEVLRLGTLPVFGVCLGYQGLAWCYGGQLDFAPQVMHGRISRVRHDQEGLFAGIPQDFEVVRYHSLVVVDRLPDDFVLQARAEDGVIMGIAHRSLPLYGIQFHPESISTQYGDRLIRNALALAGLAPQTPLLPQKRALPRPLETPPWLHCIAKPPPAEWIYAADYANQRHHFWLDSSLVRPGLSRFSFMGAVSQAGDRVVSYDQGRGSLTLQQGDRIEERQESVFAYLERQLAAPTSASLPFPYFGGYVGYFGYELKAETGGKRLHRSPWPDAALLYTQRYLVFDHEQDKLYLVAQDSEQAEAQAWFQAMERHIRTLKAPPPLAQCPSPAPFVPERDERGYLEDIEVCRQHLHDGETYEICLTNRMSGPCAEDPAVVYRRLRGLNPAPYAACLRFGELWVLSSSPEQFLHIDARGQVSSKPIKGTRARDLDPQRDAAMAADLAQAVKERSENLMIVDLLRNDLGKVCEVGSVHVPHLMEVESYATVHQLVSTVRGQLLPEASAIDCLRAAFPGGSMTGAPKLRTMELIDSLEQSARGIYSGCIGYLSRDGAADLSIVIRTAIIENGTATIGTGGAVVALSETRAEYEETLLKARVIQKAFAEN